MVITPTMKLRPQEHGHTQKKTKEWFNRRSAKCTDNKIMRKKKKKKENNGNSEDETDDGNSSNAGRDQNSDISFMNETDEEIDSAEIEEEDWIEHMKTSTDEAMQRMKTAKIQCWIKAPD